MLICTDIHKSVIGSFHAKVENYTDKYNEVKIYIHQLSEKDFSCCLFNHFSFLDEPGDNGKTFDPPPEIPKLDLSSVGESKIHLFKHVF